MNTSPCPNCAEPVAAGVRFCPACGTSVATRVQAAVSEGTDYVSERWEPYLSLAEFLVAEGRADDAQPWLAKMRETIALFGPASPLIAHVERRLAATARPTPLSGP